MAKELAFETSITQLSIQKLSPQSPWTGVIGAAAGMGLFSWISLQYGIAGWWGTRIDRPVLLWMVVSVVFLIMGLFDQVMLGGHRAHPNVRPSYHATWKPLFCSSLWRFLALLVVLSAARYVYFSHPFYGGAFYEPFRRFFPVLYAVFLVVGFPYILLTLRWRAGSKAELKDPGLHVLLWTRTLGRIVLNASRRHRCPAFNNRRSKIVFLGFLVEFFFLPLMTVFLHNQFMDFAQAIRTLHDPRVPVDFNGVLYPLCYHGLYLMDVLLASGGYALPMRWLDNKIESVEPTLVGWVVALVCYPPFDMIANTYITYGSASGTWLMHRPVLFFTSKIFVLVFAAIYSIATLMFGTRFSNLTHRGILTRGPYGVVRHPAYAAKNLSWWMEKLGRMDNPFNILSLALWNGIYVWRAWTEERHLGQDPIYREYCRRIRYRFIPGLI